MNIRENESLARHTTLRTGGPARYFIEAVTEEDIRGALDFARQRALPIFVLGGGSNVLVRDAGFAGVVLKIATRGLAIREASAPVTEVVAEAGEEWDALVAFAVGRGLHGLENMSLIPGSVGAAVTGNIGAYGSEMKDSLVWAETLDLRDGTARRLTHRECQFSYRHSFFKTTDGRKQVVLRAAFALRRAGALSLRYHDLREHFASRRNVEPTLAEVRRAVIEIRQRKLPDPVHVGTAGSFFKNPVIARAQFEALMTKHPGLPGHEDGPDRVKVPLGWILDRICGLKGARRGRVGTHPHQALCLINEGGSAAEVTAFAEELARHVREKTGLEIEWEVERV